MAKKPVRTKVKMQKLRTYCQNLKLAYMKDNLEAEILRAQAQGLDHKTFIEGLLERELALRKENAVKTRLRNAQLPYQMSIADFKTDHLSQELKLKIKELSSLKFIDNNENIILVGNPGVGKTALAVSLMTTAAISGYKVLFVNIGNLVIELREAMSLNQISRYKKKFEKYECVVIDELGYCSFDSESGQILFNLLSARNDKGSIVITSNLTVDRWNEVFTDELLTGAIVDRLAYKAHMIDMTGDSYRILETQQWRKNGNLISN